LFFAFVWGPDGSTAVLGRAQKNSARPTRKARRQGHVRHFEFAIS
jgi:hypothetical protein